MSKPPLPDVERCKILLRTYIAAMALLTGFPVLAQQPVLPSMSDIDIYFYGYVHPYIPPPCTFNVDTRGHINNSSSNVVVLSKAGIPALRNAGNRVLGANVRFSSRGCTGLYIDYMWVYFSAGNVDIEGRVIPSGGSGVLRFELVDADSGNRIKVGTPSSNPPQPDVSYQGTAAQFQGPIMTNQIREAVKYYQVYYYTPTGLTLGDVGQYSATMTANFVYY